MKLSRIVISSAATAVIALGGLVAVPATVAAQASRQGAAAASTAQAQTVFVENQDARETRQALMEVLKRYPPSLGSILKLDPSLLSNPAYLSSYPALSQFLQQHPDVVRSPAYFFESVYRVDYRENAVSDRDRGIDMWRSVVGDFMFLMGFLSVVGAIAWVIKSVVDHRRWSRLSKVQAEVHNKLIDRLASNDEMLSYIQSPAGAGFLKAGPTAIGNGAKSMHAPFGRILWSAQAGVVLLALGVGLRWVTVSGPNEVVEMLRFFGLIGQALGVGFLASSGLAYVLSRQMGLIDAAAAARTERDTPSHS